jgi:type IV pilus assembly protein PilB
MFPKRFVSKKIGQILIESGIVTKDQIQQAVDLQNEKGGIIGSILIALGYVTEEQIAHALTAQFGFPYLPLSNYALDRNIVRLIPKDAAIKHNLIAIDKIGNSLTIAMSDPLNAQVTEEIESITKCNIQIFLSTPTDIKDAIKRYYELA